MPNSVRFNARVAPPEVLSGGATKSSTKQMHDDAALSNRHHPHTAIPIASSKTKEDFPIVSASKAKTVETEGPSRGSLSGMDKLIYHMSSGNKSGMIINGALMMEGKVMKRQECLDRVRERVAQKHVRFRSKVVRGSTWIESPVDLSYHVKFTTLESRANLSSHMTRQVHDSLDPDRPLWQVEFISTPRGKVVGITFRIHHVIGDGLSMMLLLYSLLDDAVEADPYRDLPLGKKKIPCCFMILYWIRVLFCFPFAILGLAFMGRDKRNALHVKSHQLQKKPRGAKCDEVDGAVIWSKPISLRSLKRLRKKAKCSLNDCLSALIAGAIRRYFVEIGESVASDIRCVIPVSVRQMGTKSLKINNQVSSVFLKLPISESDPVTRLRKTKRRMDALKYGATIWAVYILTHLLTFLPRKIGQYLNMSFMNRCSLIFSNVPGKSTASSLVGNRILGVLGVVPLYGEVGSGITCITFDGNAFVTLQAHAGMPRPDLITKFLSEEFTAMCEAHQIEPPMDDPMTQLEMKQCHAGWLASPEERSDYMKGLVPCDHDAKPPPPATYAPSMKTPEKRRDLAKTVGYPLGGHSGGGWRFGVVGSGAVLGGHQVYGGV